MALPPFIPSRPRTWPTEAVLPPRTALVTGPEIVAPGLDSAPFQADKTAPPSGVPAPDRSSNPTDPFHPRSPVRRGPA